MGKSQSNESFLVYQIREELSSTESFKKHDEQISEENVTESAMFLIQHRKT